MEDIKTSVKTYEEMMEEGLLGKMEKRVLAMIKKHPLLCDREYSQISGLRINQITGRRNNLVESGCVIDAGTKEDLVTKRTVHIWLIPDRINYRPRTKKKLCPMCQGKGVVQIE
jgi:hypothetical protein